MYVILWPLGQVSMYLLFTSNLKHTFEQNPKLKISQFCLNILIISMIIFFLSTIVYITLYLFYYIHIITADMFALLAAISNSFIEISDFIISTSLLQILFPLD